MSRRSGYQPKRRNTGERIRRSVILLAAEGKNKTETQYFTDLARALNKNIRFAPGNDTDPIHMVNTLCKAFSEYGLAPELGDKAFCLVDTDVDPNKNAQLAKADDISNKKGVALIVSSPCFEVWCLCHYGKNSTHFSSSSAVVEEVMKKIPGYQKSGEGLYQTLAPNTMIAIENAKTLEKVCVNAGYLPHTVEFSPSTEIYKVIEALLSK